MKELQDILDWIKNGLEFDINFFSNEIQIMNYNKYRSIDKAIVHDVQLVRSPVIANVSVILPRINLMANNDLVYVWNKPIYIKDNEYDVLLNHKQDINDIFIQVAKNIKYGITIEVKLCRE